MTRLKPWPHPLAMHRPTPTAVLDALDGATVAGGCDTCDAEQRVERIRGLARITKITVVHERGVPDPRPQDQEVTGDGRG